MPNPKGNPNIKKYGIPYKGKDALKNRVNLGLSDEMYQKLQLATDSIPDFIRQAISEKLEKIQNEPD